MGSDNSEIVVFKPQDGETEFQVVLDGQHDTVWATELQIAEFFWKIPNRNQSSHKEYIQGE